MDSQDWLAGYRRLLTFRASGLPSMTLQRYWAYWLIAFILAAMLILGMIWQAFRAGHRNHATQHTIRMITGTKTLRISRA